jgi:xylulose-5-phosphate/fructose-6-phosphate phosphoketolase
MTVAANTHLEAAELRALEAYWRAANYLSVGQINLLDNPVLREPLRPEHVKAATAGPLGHDARPQPDLHAPQPRNPST